MLLGAVVLYVAIGGLRTVVGGIGSTLAGFVDGVTATPSPSVTPVPVSDAPSLAAPDEPYTANTSVDLIVTVPSRLVGATDYRIRVYLALQDQQPTPIQEAPIGDTGKTIIPVTLSKGINDFSVSIVGPGGELEQSAVVRYVLDTTKPKITITSPKNNATVNGTKVTINGTTQARSTLIARNTDNGSSVSGTAGADGTFSLSLALGKGLNHIVISATDPAGNPNSTNLVITRGTGKLTVAISASAYTISQKSLPQRITLTCVLTDPNGAALAGASYTFTLSIPGMQTVTAQGTTDANGKATFSTNIGKGAQVGQGNATVLVSTTDFGSTQDLTVITITK